MVMARCAGFMAPMDELGALLEGRAAAADQLGLVDADARKCLADGRERALAHAKDANVLRFDQRHFEAARPIGAEHPGQITRGYPPGGAAADDQDLTNTGDHRSAPRAWWRAVPRHQDGRSEDEVNPEADAAVALEPAAGVYSIVGVAAHQRSLRGVEDVSPLVRERDVVVPPEGEAGIHLTILVAVDRQRNLDGLGWSAG